MPTEPVDISILPILIVMPALMPISTAPFRSDHVAPDLRVLRMGQLRVGRKNDCKSAHLPPSALRRLPLAEVELLQHLLTSTNA